MYTLRKFKTRGVGLVIEEFVGVDYFIGYYYTFKSNRESTGRIRKNEGKLLYETYPFGRYINHNHTNPNLTSFKDHNGVGLKTIKPINPNTELTINYNDIIKDIDIHDKRYVDFTYVEEPVPPKTNLI